MFRAYCCWMRINALHQLLGGCKLIVRVKARPDTKYVSESLGLRHFCFKSNVA